MKRKKIIMIIAGVVVALGLLFSVIFIAPVIRENESKERVFPELKERLDEVESSVIGILPKTENKNDGSVTYGYGGSGVIFKQENGTYYALTAAHVVGDESGTYKAYTAKTEYTTVDDPAFDQFGIEVVDNSFYDKLSDVKVEYVSETDDIAVVSFRSADSLIVAELGSDPTAGEKVLCLGHPDGKKLTASYGFIISDLKSVTMRDKYSGTEHTDSVYEHDAYLNPGSSGGAVFSDDLQLCGINVGGSFDAFEHFSGGFMIPASRLQNCIDEWDVN